MWGRNRRWRIQVVAATKPVDHPQREMDSAVAPGDRPAVQPVRPAETRQAYVGPVRRKKADVVVGEIKRRIDEGEIHVGERLPQEIALAAQFHVSKGTIREALKSLEVQGLVRNKTGPAGGATITNPGMETAVDLARNYFRTRDITIAEIYVLRKAVEPMLAVSVVGNLSERSFAELEASVGFCSCHPLGGEARQMQRISELDFHDVLADVCTNRALAFQCRLLNDMLKNQPICRAIFAQPTADLAERGRAYHIELLSAFRAEDRERVGKLMYDHMCEAEKLMTKYESAVRGRWS